MEKRKIMLSSQLKNKLFLLLFIALFTNRAIATEFEVVYQSALKNSTELARTKATADEATALFKASNSNFMPRAGIESRYETFDSDLEEVKGGTTNGFVEWNLFNGFRDVQNRKGLGADAKAANLERQRTESNFKWIAMAKYTKAQAMQDNVETYKKVIDSNLKNLQTVKLRRSSGRLSDSDLIEFELFDSKLKQDLISLETDASAVVAQLEAFSGVNSISKLTTQLEPKKLRLDDLNLRELLKSEKSKLHESQLKVDAAQARKSLATGSFLPEVNLKATHGSLGLRETEVSPETAFGVTAKWELFSGFESLNHRRVASAQLVKAKADFENTRIQSIARAEQLRNQLKSILTRWEFEQKNQKNIEKFLKTVQEEYRRGAKNSNDLKSALELILETQVNRTMLRADYFEARAELQQILGIELKEQ